MYNNTWLAGWLGEARPRLALSTPQLAALRVRPGVVRRDVGCNDGVMVAARACSSSRGGEGGRCGAAGEYWERPVRGCSSRGARACSPPSRRRRGGESRCTSALTCGGEGVNCKHVPGPQRPDVKGIHPVGAPPLAQVLSRAATRWGGWVDGPGWVWVRVGRGVGGAGSWGGRRVEGVRQHRALPCPAPTPARSGSKSSAHSRGRGRGQRGGTGLQGR